MPDGLFGPDDKLIHPKQSDDVSLLIETAVEAKVNTQMDNLREALRTQHTKDSILGWVRYSILALINASLAVALYMFGPEVVLKWTQGFVETKMNEPLLKDAADRIMTSKMEGYIDKQFQDVEKRLHIVSSRIESIEPQVEFQDICARALSGDYTAFKELESTFSGTINEMRANRLIELIKRDLEEQRSMFRSQQSLYESAGKFSYSEHFTNDEVLLAMYWSDPKGQEAAVNWVQEHNLKIFLPDLVALLEKNNDLMIRNRITFAISKMESQDFKAWQSKEVHDWWKNKAKDAQLWPLATFIEGANLIQSHDFAGAAEKFEAVLTADPAADESRALAVHCYLKMGNTARAKELQNNFFKRQGRWNDFADAQILLFSGDTSKATESVLAMIQKYPTFAVRVIQEPDTWKGVDWEKVKAEWKKISEDK